MKIIDCFMFYNELDILKIRFEELYDVVDYFIIIEGVRTHSNAEKPLYFTENKNLFSKYLDKIIHRFTDFEENYDFSKHIKVENDNWYRENYQRECCRNVIDELELKDDDIIIISDCDEIPKKSVIENIKNRTLCIENNIYSIEMVLYYYNIELTTFRRWYHAKLLNYYMYKKFNLLTSIRLSYEYFTILDAGYHLTYFGDVNFIKNKIDSFAESSEYSKEGKSLDYLQECYKSGILHFNKEKLIYVPLSTNDNVPLHFKSKT